MKVTKGDFKEFGPRVVDDGIVFTIAKSKTAKHAGLILFEKNTKKKIQRIELSEGFAIGDVYSVLVSGIDSDSICYLIEEDGQTFIDPYSTSIVGRDVWAADKQRSSQKYQVYSGISRLDSEWKDAKPQVNPSDMVMYKLHMRGFTYGNGMTEPRAGSYKGVISKIPYLKKLGITSVELMPIYDFEELFLENVQMISKRGHRVNHLAYTGKVNYWGYGEASYFAPKASYFDGHSDSIDNFTRLVKAFHKENMECIMEMSFAENVTESFIIDCLKYYVKYFHIDGFHILGCNCPIVRIADEPYLAKTKIFCEYIPNTVLEKEKGRKHLFLYNDYFMNASRQLQNHMNGSMVQFANHIRRQNEDYGFVNYMSSVCGFSLWDSYSYGEKHNWDNGEDNRDGNNFNFSYNYGAEGPTKNKLINSNRFLQMRNGFTILLLAQSIPLIVAGDEWAATHDGNNNPYCQDNKIGYTVFSKNKNKKVLYNFVHELIKFRHMHKCIRPDNAFLMNDYKHLGLPDMSFHGSEPWMMYIGEEQKALGVLYNGKYADEQEEVYVCYNFHYDSVEMALPLLEPGKRWRQVFNTSDFDENSDFVPKAINNQQSIIVDGSSITVLIGMKP